MIYTGTRLAKHQRTRVPTFLSSNDVIQGMAAYNIFSTMIRFIPVMLLPLPLRMNFFFFALNSSSPPQTPLIHHLPPPPPFSRYFNLAFFCLWYWLYPSTNTTPIQLLPFFRQLHFLTLFFMTCARKWTRTLILPFLDFFPSTIQITLLTITKS